MERLNLTLDADTLSALDRHAKASGKPRAAVARELLLEALARQETLAWRKKLAEDYAHGRADASAALAALAGTQLDLLDDDEGA
jgi:hypothetical protein